jgi:hypothetical protein
MVSEKTAEDIVNVLLRYVSPQIAFKMAGELAQVEGNKSFRDTVKLVRKLAGRRADGIGA